MPEKTSDKGNGGHRNVGELRSGPIAGSALVSGATFQAKPLIWADVDGWAVFEGDIILGRTEVLRAAAQADGGPVLQSIGITGQRFRWPNATVPFDIAAGMPDQQRVTDAIAHWEANTTLRFRRRTASDADFVMFQGGGGCSSQVGRQGGEQFVTLGAGCSTGNAIHEIGHTIGFWHEQSREDRDTFVRIEWANIDSSMQHNFTQHIADGDDLGAYDYGSIMHYPANAFSKNGQATITPLQPIPPGMVMGQRNGLSAGDIAGALALYPRPTVTVKEVVKDGRKDPSKDPIADTIKEVRKDPIQDTAKEVGKDPAQDTIKEVRKDPIQDTAKEVGKDPAQDTIKEVRKDPITDTVKEIQKEPARDTVKEVRGDPTLAETVFPPGPGPQFGQQIPFTMARGSQFGGGSGDIGAGDGMTDVQALAEAIIATEQQLAELQAMYDAAVAAQGGATGGGLT